MMMPRVLVEQDEDVKRKRHKKPDRIDVSLMS